MNSEHRSLPPHIYQRIAILLVLFAFFMSALISRSVFERLPHLEDEVAYLYQAKVFSRGDLVLETPQPRRAFWQPFVVDYEGNRFSKYTPGWSAILSLGVNLGQAWIINAFFSALTVALVYRLGRKLFNEDVGLIAAGLTAFSPMALLLNASLMGHTSALFFTTLFIEAMRLIDKRGGLRWGIVAGLALGVIVITRPLSAVGIALPFIIWSVWRVLVVVHHNRKSLLPTLRPLLVLAGCTLFLSAAILIYNQATSGNATQNLYTLVWEYDRIGYGECCGRNGHTLEKGIRHTRFDLSLTAADLFGWSIGNVTPEVQDHLRLESDYYPIIGLSFFLLPIGTVLGLLSGSDINIRNRLFWIAMWTLIAIIWLILPLKLESSTIRDPGFSWFWLVVAAGWLLLPLLRMHQAHLNTPRWTWLLLSALLGLVLVQMTYWIGSQRYSTRYYFEALTSAAILTAIPIGYLARRWRRLPVYSVLLAALVYSLYAYSTPRIEALYRFNFIGNHILEGIEERRISDDPVLVIVNGASSGDDRVRWRALGTLMVVTSPYFDSDIVGAWDYGIREELVALFPDRPIIEMAAQGNDVWFVDD